MSSNVGFQFQCKRCYYSGFLTVYYSGSSSTIAYKCPMCGKFYGEDNRESNKQSKKGSAMKYHCPNCGLISTDNLDECLRCGIPKEQ